MHQPASIPRDAYRAARARIRAAALDARERDRAAARRIRHQIDAAHAAMLADLLAESVR